MIKVLFICMGNICRSPTAHGVFQKMVDDAGLSDQIYVDSCGTGDWHLGKGPDMRAQQAAAKRNYDLSSLVARQIVAEDFDQFDYVLPMDKQNMLDMRHLYNAQSRAEFCLFLDYLYEDLGREVPDPYYEGEEGFEEVLDLAEKACANLLDFIRDNDLDD